MNFIFYEILFKKKLKWKLLLLLSQSSSILFYFLVYASENVSPIRWCSPSPSKFLKKLTWRHSHLFTGIAYKIVIILWFNLCSNEVTKIPFTMILNFVTKRNIHRKDNFISYLSLINPSPPAVPGLNLTVQWQQIFVSLFLTIFTANFAHFQLKSIMRMQTMPQ